MTKRKRYKKPLIKKLQEDMGHVVSEIMMIKNHIRDALQPQMQSFMAIFEKYLEYKNETEDFLQFMERETENVEKSKEVTYEKQRRGRRNRQRGAELQRQAVNLAKGFNLEAFNRDRGGAQHEQGDIEIDGIYYGCKRRKVIPKWVLPEKEEIGVVFRGDNMEPYISIPLDKYFLLLSLMKG